MSVQYSEDTIHLLQETSSGCKMAIDTIDHIKSHVEDKQLREIIDKYHDSHVDLQQECMRALYEAGAEEKEPNTIAQTFATVQSRIKMFMEDDDRSMAASLLTDGCNMGVKTMSEHINQYKNANEDSVKMAERLRNMEERMIGDLQPML